MTRMDTDTEQPRTENTESRAKMVNGTAGQRPINKPAQGKDAPGADAALGLHPNKAKAL